MNTIDKLDAALKRVLSVDLKDDDAFERAYFGLAIAAIEAKCGADALYRAVKDHLAGGHSAEYSRHSLEFAMHMVEMDI